MYKHVLVPVALGHEDLVDRKIELARNLLSEGGKITLLTVLEDVPGFVAEFVTVKETNHLSAQGKGRLDELAKGSDNVTTDVVTGKAGVRIVQYADEKDIDLIVVGSHAPGIQDYFLGSTAARVARRAPCAVHIVR